MRVLLINPAIRPNSPKTMLNVGLAYVASAIHRAGYDLEILDIDAYRYSEEEVERLIRTKRFDVAGIGDLVSHYRWVKEIAGVIKTYHPKATIMVGNTCGTSIPRLLLERTAVDIAVISEADETVVDLLQHLEAGGPLDEVKGIAFKRGGDIVENCGRPVIEPVDSIPFPNYDLFDIGIYLEKSRWHVNGPDVVGIPFDEIIAMPIVTARGCPFKCTFCYHAFQNKKYRYRSPENIVAEIEELKWRYGVNFVNFWDELSFYRKDQTRRLADLFIERKVGVKWEGTCRSELIGADDFDLALRLKEAGCTGLSFSLENGNDEILKAMNKLNTTEDFVTQARVLQEVGIPTFTSIVFGYPQETPATIRETFEILRRARIYPSVGYLQPMPGTPMYDLARREGYIDDEEGYLIRMGDRQDLRVNMTRMPQEEMEAIVVEELRRLNADLRTGLSEEELIRTRVYRTAKSDSFMHSFGVAARVLRETEGMTVDAPPNPGAASRYGPTATPSPIAQSGASG